MHDSGRTLPSPGASGPDLSDDVREGHLAWLEEQRAKEPEAGYCGKCHSGTGWEWNDDEEGWVSVCCGWGPLAMDRDHDDA